MRPASSSGAPWLLTATRPYRETIAAVVLADYKEDAVKAAARKLAAAGQKAIAVKCDVSDDA